MATSRRNSLRLPDYDYSSSGYYFITACTHARALLFDYPHYRNIAQEQWTATPRHFPFAVLDAFVIMPNHIHAIVRLEETEGRAGVLVDRLMMDSTTTTPAPTTAHASAWRDLALAALPRIVRSFKTLSGRRINRVRRSPGEAVWQRGYWEHIVRNERDLDRIRAYIAENPMNWETDPENPRRSAAGAVSLWEELIGAGALYLVND